MSRTSMKRRIPIRLLAQRSVWHDSILCCFRELRVLPIRIWWMRDWIHLRNGLAHQSFRGSHNLSLRYIWNISSKGSRCESWSWTCLWSMGVWHNWTPNRFLIMMGSLLSLRLSTKTWWRPCALSARLWLVLLVAIERAEKPVLLIKHVFEFNS